MMCSNRCIHIVLFLSLAICTHGNIENTVVLVGEDTILTFAISGAAKFISWQEYITDTISGTLIYSNNMLVYIGDASRYSLVETSSSSQFTISDTQLTDAGTYKVQNLAAGGSAKGAAIIVLGTDISCSWSNSDSSLSNSYVVAADVIEVACDIQYEGEWAPVLTCTGNDVSSWTTADQSASGSASYLFTTVVDSGAISIDITCDANFENPTPSEYVTDFAQNIPDYTSDWTSGSIDVYRAATTISVTPVQALYEVDDVITCTASGGNPSPSYTWTIVASGTQVSTTDTLIVTSDMDGQTLECVAITNIRGLDYDTTSQLAIDIEQDTTSTSTTTSTTTTTTTSTTIATTTTRKTTTTRILSTNARTSGSTPSTSILTHGDTTVSVEQGQTDTAVVIIVVVSVTGGMLIIIGLVFLGVFCIKKSQERRRVGAGYHEEHST